MEQIPFRDTNKLGAPTLINCDTWVRREFSANTAPIARNAVSLPILASSCEHGTQPNGVQEVSFLSYYCVAIP